MSYCREEGKDKIIFMTKEDYEAPSKQVLSEDDEDEQAGLILPNGEINWQCPCLGGMATGPCGYEFREAFSCFHYSEADPKGSDCIEQFSKMQGCMQGYPELYDYDKDEKKDDNDVQENSKEPSESEQNKGTEVDDSDNKEEAKS